MTTPNTPNEKDTPVTSQPETAPEEVSAAEAFGNKLPTPPRRKRRKLWIPIVASALTVTLLGGLLAVLLLNPPEEDSGKTTSSTTSESDKVTVLADKRVAEDSNIVPLTKLHIATPLETFTICPNADGDLQLEDCTDLPRNSAMIASLVETLSLVETEKTVIEKPEDAGEFGFDQPMASVDITYHDGDTLQFDLCALPLGSDSGYYLRVKGTEPIYLVSAELGDAVLQKKSTYIGINLFTSPNIKENDTNGSIVLKELSLAGSMRSEVVTMRKWDTSLGSEYESISEYVMTKPYYVDTNQQNIATIIGTLTLTADSVAAIHPTDEQLAEYGLDKPFSVAKLVTAVYTYTTDSNDKVTDDSFYDERENLVLLGNTDENGNYYAQVNGLDAVYVLTPDSVPWATSTYNDLASAYLFLRQIANLKNITCIVSGKEYSFDLQHKPEEEKIDDQMIVTMDGKQYETDAFRTLFQVLMTIPRTGDATADPTGEPTLVVRLEPTDSNHRTLEISLYKKSASVYICETSTGDLYRTSASRVDYALEQIDNYLNGRPVYRGN